jgi:hypothetical protein
VGGYIPAPGGYRPVGWYPGLAAAEWEAVIAAKARRDELAKQARPTDPAALIRDVDVADADAIESAIAWLETDVFTWRTGYLKQKIMGRLCSAPMTPTQQDRIRAICSSW